MTFKEKLVRLRKLKGLTQDEFAGAVGVSRQAVYKWESGQSYPEVSKLLEIKALFNISIDDLLDENYEVVLPEKKKRKRVVKDTKPEAQQEDINEQINSAIEKETVSEAPIAEQEPAIAATVAKQTSEPVVEASAEAVEQPATEQTLADESAEEEESKKKVGFFGRIFGRK